MIQFSCECGRQLQARDENVGKSVKCPICGAVTVVPSSQAIAPGDVPERSRPDAVRPDRPDDRDRDRDEDDRPRRSRDRDRDEDDRPRRKRSEVSGGTSGKATTAMILGLLSFVCGFTCLTGIPAIIFGILALQEIGKSDGRVGGKGMAITGLITGCIGIFSLPIMFALLLPAVQKVRSAAERAQEQNNLKQMGTAMHNIASSYNGGFPAAAAYRSPTGKPLLSWRVAMLPYIEQQNLYMQFKLDEPWDSPNNIKLLPVIPRTYQQPGETPDGKGLTHYQVLVGPGTPFDESAGKQGKVGDLWFGSNLNRSFNMKGTSNTILITTAEQGVPWTKPEDLRYDPKGPLPVFSKRFSGGFNVGMADGSVHFVSNKVSEKTLRDAITINHANPLGSDW